MDIHTIFSVVSDRGVRCVCLLKDLHHLAEIVAVNALRDKRQDDARFLGGSIVGAGSGKITY